MHEKPLACSGCQLFEGPYGRTKGFVPSAGAGDILIVGEAPGQDEEQEGVPFVGASGHALFQQLKRVSIERESFTIHNVLSCRPPDNKLVKMPYEQSYIAHCSPNLDATIERVRQQARANGKTFVIVSLGKTAFQRVMGYDYKHNAELLK